MHMAIHMNVIKGDGGKWVGIVKNEPIKQKQNGSI